MRPSLVERKSQLIRLFNRETEGKARPLVYRDRKGNLKMKRRQLLSLLGMSPALLAASAEGKHKVSNPNQGASTALAGEPKYVALSPKGTPPPVNRFPLAARSNTSLEGKSVYLVDTGFFGADLLLEQVAGWFGRNIPSVKIVMRKKAGTYPEQDPKLWEEIKANASATIMAIGH